ncbi:MFS transporter [Nocardioides sp. YIM 152315]|uniref:MFS transporter n=1 Tax=Nocardioides sp. YIM 152315 TaxID=3031760 RepID=UPI0023DA2C50|nr:MFS transporter [Nocardioides sp. YIM 152315]MDF1605436.1 MFS transporter [Nocardioides sp. YIM 152315]
MSTARCTEVVEPTTPVDTRWLWLFGLAWLGFWLLVMLPGQIMLAQLAKSIHPGRKVELVSLFQAVMLLTVVLVVPLVGYLCDRTVLAWGRRRVWAVGGFALASVTFVLVGFTERVPLVCLLLVLVAVGEACVLVALSAMIADQVPVAQRGRASAAFGVSQVLALAGGMVVVTSVITDVTTGWLVIGVAALVVCLPFLLGRREPAPSPTARVRGGLRHNIAPPRLAEARDYYWAMATRVLINAGNLVGTTYLLYYADDVLRRSNPDAAVLALTLVYLIFCVFATYAAGVVSDRLLRRRPLVVAGGMLQVLAALLLVVSPTWGATMIAACLLGIGYGAFLSVDQALTTDVLPQPETRARDLGLVNAAQHLPIAPLVGFTVLAVTGESYRALYAAAAAVMVMGVWSVTRIRGVR